MAEQIHHTYLVHGKNGGTKLKIPVANSLGPIVCGAAVAVSRQEPISNLVVSPVLGQPICTRVMSMSHTLQHYSRSDPTQHVMASDATV